MNGMEKQIKAWAEELGFDDCRIARATQAAHADVFREWLSEGKHGGMAWLERTPERRCDPREVMPGWSQDRKDDGPVVVERRG